MFENTTSDTLLVLVLITDRSQYRYCSINVTRTQDFTQCWGEKKSSAGFFVDVHLHGDADKWFGVVVMGAIEVSIC